MIRIRNLHKRFGRVTVLDGIDLDVRPGRITALVGPNAAGKTTLIKSVLGLTRPDSGIIEVAGKPIDEFGAYRASIGYMPQIARFPDHLTGNELLEMMRGLRGGNPGRDDELIHEFGLIDVLRKPLGVLSGGTRQKINLALAFQFAPPCLILDEPTAGLDPLAAAVVKRKIIGGRESGMTFVLTTHVMSELEELADDLAFLVDGKIRFAGPVHDLKKATRQLSLDRAIAFVLEGGLAA